LYIGEEMLTPSLWYEGVCANPGSRPEAPETNGSAGAEETLAGPPEKSRVSGPGSACDDAGF
jgi:hypothetical protein